MPPGAAIDGRPPIALRSNLAPVTEPVSRLAQKYALVEFHWSIVGMHAIHLQHECFKHYSDPRRLSGGKEITFAGFPNRRCGRKG
jgi:hypothetical protein